MKLVIDKLEELGYEFTELNEDLFYSKGNRFLFMTHIDNAYPNYPEESKETYRVTFKSALSLDDGNVIKDLAEDKVIFIDRDSDISKFIESLFGD